MTANGTWGEALDDDGLMPAAAVRDWAQLAPEEAVRFFPALRATRAMPRELANRVLERAAEIERGVAGRGGGRRMLESRQNAAWLRRLVAGDRAPQPDMALMARFGFLTGLHPAYVWPEAECLPCWGATAAWLGEWSRRGRAFLPPEVAEYLADVLERRGRRMVLRDASLADLIPDEAAASRLLKAAERRLAGERVEARRPAEPRFASAWARLRRALAVFGFSRKPLRWSS